MSSLAVLHRDVDTTLRSSCTISMAATNEPFTCLRWRGSWEVNRMTRAIRTNHVHPLCVYPPPHLPLPPNPTPFPQYGRKRATTGLDNCRLNASRPSWVCGRWRASSPTQRGDPLLPHREGCHRKVNASPYLLRRRVMRLCTSDSTWGSLSTMVPSDLRPFPLQLVSG